jgi:hypothetical protein
VVKAGRTVHRAEIADSSTGAVFVDVGIIL